MDHALVVTRNANGTYEIFFQGKRECSRVQERWLEHELCIRYGFCGEEYDAIIRQLNASGKAVVELWLDFGTAIPRYYHAKLRHNVRRNDDVCSVYRALDINCFSYQQHHWQRHIRCTG